MKRNPPTKDPHKTNDIFPRCRLCGARLPLLHPHIIVERTDENGEPICEACYAKKLAEDNSAKSSP